ncbi:hypothetical protein [Ornithinicoccus hortensis]|uniref:Dihydroorotate oxidase B catalytic subunit n=1 Tax=Ornithinicoccus hortensis TaxID=82346 RepID=A0A542YSJ4_9MICO|nr:hypothetical protein [Ornithinicoccus hortensis]TQL51037.1 dihydroorotate oxidase B catalytic subunit [Ornithinicoccus hortensis]
MTGVPGVAGARGTPSWRAAGVPRVTAAAGCGGTGAELARFGDLAALDAVLLGPVGVPSQARPAPARIEPVPGGILHTAAPVLSVRTVVTAHLPWLAARQLRTVCAVRGTSVAEVAEVVTRLRRGLDFDTVCGIEVDLTAGDEQQPGSQRRAFQDDDQSCLRLMARLRELLPRDLPLLAKVGLDCADPVAAVRSSVAGGAAAVVLSGTVAAHPPGTRLAGPAIARVTAGAVDRMVTAMAQGRVPTVPVIAGGGIHDPASAAAAVGWGAHGVQVGTALFGDPGVLWRVTETVARAAAGGAHDDEETG